MWIGLESFVDIASPPAIHVTDDLQGRWCLSRGDVNAIEMHRTIIRWCWASPIGKRFYDAICHSFLPKMWEKIEIIKHFIS
jgi:hypothetical protein